MDLIVLFAFGMFSIAAARDWLTGRIPFFLLAGPILLVAACYPAVFAAAFVPLFAVLFGMRLIIEYFQIHGKLKPGTFVLGEGDVLGVPLILTVCFIAHPFFGPVSFVTAMALLLPVMARGKNQTKRFLPWLIPPSATALLISFLAVS